MWQSELILAPGRYRTFPIIGRDLAGVSLMTRDSSIHRHSATPQPHFSPLGYVDTIDVINTKAAYQAYLTELAQLQQENVKRALRGAEPLKVRGRLMLPPAYSPNIFFSITLQTKARRPPNVDEEVLLADPDCLLLTRNGVLFTETQNHRWERLSGCRVSPRLKIASLPLPPPPPPKPPLLRL